MLACQSQQETGRGGRGLTCVVGTATTSQMQTTPGRVSFLEISAAKSRMKWYKLEESGAVLTATGALKQQCNRSKTKTNGRGKAGKPARARTTKQLTGEIGS